MLESAESEMVRLISREIIFAEFQPIYDHDNSTLQTDGWTDGQTQTDGQTTCLGNTALRVTSHGKNAAVHSEFTSNQFELSKNNKKTHKMKCNVFFSLVLNLAI